MKGFCDFIAEENFNEFDASDAVSAFLELVEYMLLEKPNTIAPLMDTIIPIVASVAEQQEKYDADKDIYGDFKEKKITIMDLWREVRRNS